MALDPEAPNCAWRLDFAGCLPTVPCLPLDLLTPPCGFVAPDCGAVAAGGRCLVTCQAPCAGLSAEVYCPAGNTNPLQPLMGSLPRCVTECDFVPVGYRTSAVHASGWACGEGYTGQAAVACAASGPGKVCDTEISLQGCLEMVPCGPGTEPEAC